MNKNWNGEEYLVCEGCGYKEYDVGTVLMYKRQYPGISSKFIHYTCKACSSVKEE